jgi:hypothetical protein
VDQIPTPRYEGIEKEKEAGEVMRREKGRGEMKCSMGERDQG